MRLTTQEIALNSARANAQVAISRIDAYLIRYLKDPTAEDLEYMNFLLKSYLENSSRYALDKIVITYEKEPINPEFYPLFPREQRQADFEELEKRYEELREKHRSTVAELDELKSKTSPRKRRRGELVPVFWGNSFEQDDTADHLLEPIKREKLPVRKLAYRGLELPYVIEGGQVWFVATQALEALGIGEHWIKRTHLGEFNKRRDLNLEGIKRPSLLNFEALKRVAKQAGRNNPDLNIEGLEVLVADIKCD